MYWTLSPLPQFRFLIVKEVHSWKKLELDFELRCMKLLSQVIKTGHTKFGTEMHREFPPLTKLAQQQPTYQAGGREHRV